MTDYRWRGLSLSGGRPTVQWSASYDDPSGIYLGGNVDAVFAPEGLRGLGAQEYAGYAHKLPSGAVLDAGFQHSGYSRYYSDGAGVNFFEPYAGVSMGAASVRLHYAPDYFGTGTATLYANAAADFRLARRSRLDARIGMLIPVHSRQGAYGIRSRFDWRFGISRQIGPADLRLAWTGASAAPDYAENGRSRQALVAEFAFFF